MEQQKKEEEQKQEEEKNQNQKEEAFKQKIASSNDVLAELNDYSNYLQEKLKTAGVYIGILERQKKPITEEDNDKAHEDESLPVQVRYISASKQCQFMINKTLTQEQGPITFSIWNKPPPEAQEGEDQIEGPVEGVTFVDDVVRNPQMFYFGVPKLGSFIALPCTYQSCLFEDAFINAFNDYLECVKKRQEQDEQRHAAVEKQSARSSQKDQTKEESKIDPQAEGEEQLEAMEPEEVIEEQPFQTVKKQFVICCDTLGQDRILTNQEIQFLEESTGFLSKSFFDSEQRLLLNDVQDRIKKGDEELTFLNENEKLWEEEESEIPAFKEEDEKRSLEDQLKILELYRKRLLQIKTFMLNLKDLSLIRFPRILQTAFYYFGITQKEINEKGTNMLFWKKAKNFINEHFFIYISCINPTGSKTYKPPVYARIEKLQQNLNELNYDIGLVDEYSVVLAILFKFLNQCFTVRKLDVQKRRDIVSQKRLEKEEAERMSNELSDKKKQALEDAKNAHEQAMEQLEEGQEHTEFDEEQWLREFDERESNAPVEIPPDVQDEVDNDITE